MIKNNETPTVFFAHGKESGPWGSKIMALADLARKRGYRVESPDYSDLMDADKRVERLLGLCGENGADVLVGSSMGGYVSTVASSVIKPKGLFLMAPAFLSPATLFRNLCPAPTGQLSSTAGMTTWCRWNIRSVLPPNTRPNCTCWTAVTA